MDRVPIALHITDTHLSENTLEVNISVFQQAFEKCHELGINKIFHGGDIFTSRKGQPEIVLNAFKFILDQAQENGIVIVAIAGNHDKSNNVGEPSFLDPFTSHPAFKVMSPYGAMMFKEHGIVTHFLPYYDEDLSYPDYLSQIELDADYGHVLVTHVAINGVRNNDGTKVKNEMGLGAFAKFDLVLVGHYHNRQIFGNVVYTGSTHQVNFGEDSLKGATVLYSDLSYEFIPFDTPNYQTLDVDTETINDKLVKIVKNAAVNNCHIRLKLSGEYSEKQQPFILQLQSLGVKIERVKDDYKPIDVIAGETVQMDTQDILTHYSAWAKENSIQDSGYGLKILDKCMQ